MKLHMYLRLTYLFYVVVWNVSSVNLLFPIKLETVRPALDLLHIKEIRDFSCVRFYSRVYVFELFFLLGSKITAGLESEQRLACRN